MAESPPPERQSGKQQRDPPASGTSKPKSEATEDWKKKPGNKGTEGLTSNPKGPLDDAVEEKFAKTMK